MLQVHQLRPIIHVALPSLSFLSRALIDALFLTGGALGPSHWVAKHLGLRNRLHVVAMLEADGLPPLHRLKGWITVLHWVWAWEREGVSLCRSALRAGREPAACYRLVQRITGTSWRRVRTGGVHRVLAMFLEECGAAEIGLSATG